MRSTRGGLNFLTLRQARQRAALPANREVVRALLQSRKILSRARAAAQGEDTIAPCQKISGQENWIDKAFGNYLDRLGGWLNERATNIERGGFFTPEAQVLYNAAFPTRQSYVYRSPSLAESISNHLRLVKHFFDNMPAGALHRTEGHNTHTHALLSPSALPHHHIDPKYVTDGGIESEVTRLINTDRLRRKEGKTKSYPRGVDETKSYIENVTKTLNLNKNDLDAANSYMSIAMKKISPHSHPLAFASIRYARLYSPKYKPTFTLQP
jgi:hypothetical protein